MDITKITSRGQVVIPQDIREKEGLKEGEKLLVFSVDGTVMLKKVSGIEKAKSRESFEEILGSVWKTAAKRKLTRADAEAEISEYRKEKHAAGSS